ncbi:MAG: glycosyl transferase [Nitrospira sp.]|uniref:Glucosyl-3-phosphoglycerate synthase n=1 Tax=Candidatus Nitrospira nitrosa TaxID=1742972 RepID=A0A0S4LQG1_9BACT|nr:glycosyl transferase [Candidatus Nitrospira nitrosa]MBK9949483.1 glycosyl transferase [Nitrospira sp.]MBL8074637.1 glycosyl transferase [Nitrospira sp.]OYT20190.1 MAG: glycosyl transferase [Nitrospira sp. UW-LDO-01]CUS38848.1 Glucosyl-3-phosphoglycerate synthase [Candidatus Nitrospira nitrosa]
MSDFYQNGVVTVLHRLGQPNTEQLEQELERYAKTTPIALVLPSLYAELERPALKRIVDILSDVRYINEIVISLDHASALEFRLAKQFFSHLPQRVRVVWNDGARIQAILNVLVSHEIDIGHQGKGRGCWTAYGYVLARGQSQIIALHDCDIVSYDRQYLARLCYPIANPNLAYEFCKGYYSRVTDRMHGRVTRLFMTPLIRSLQMLVGPHSLLSFLDSFRYPLAGEFAMVRDLAWINRIPGDWGLEVGMLAEVYRNCALRRICQADIADAYEHKHQTLSTHNPDAGLLKMCVDITKSLFRNLASEGLVLSESTLKTLRATYLQAAQEAISRYENDAAINSLRFDRHEERRAVEVFLRGMTLATDSFLEDPLGVPMISNWSRVTHAVPDIFHRLMDAVEQDHAWDPAAETRQPVS